MISSCKRTLKVADIGLQLCGSSSEDVVLDSRLEAFREDEGAFSIRMTVEWEPFLREETGARLFDSGGVWVLRRNGDQLVFDFSSPATIHSPYRRLLVDQSFSEARMLLSRKALQGVRPVFALEYPADELLFTNFLAAEGLGAEVHGCGLIDRENGGYLFLGHSGAGKSTTARLWQQLRNPEILSDDRIILRIDRGELWMHGTPWHGEGQFALPKKATIEKIFILRHANKNYFVPLSKSRAAGELFARCFPPFHSPEGLQSTVEFLDQVVSLVPCFEFGFVPDASAVEAASQSTHATIAA
jgi:hypothetical protein